MKKIHNISHFCAVSEIKPEIANVLIKNNLEKHTVETVATDSYRLASITYSTEDFWMLERIQTGLYEPRAFREMCAVLNKKRATIEQKLEAIKQFSKFKRDLSPDSYPDYMQLFKKNDSQTSYRESIMKTYTASYLADHIKLVSEFSERGEFNAGEHKEFDHSCLEFKNDEARVLLMAIYRP